MKVVKVGPIGYDIILIPDLHGNGRTLFGTVKHAPCEVHIEASLAPPMQRQTLWHEILHIVLEQLARGELDNDEGFVDSLAYALMQVVQDNPFLAEEAK